MTSTKFYANYSPKGVGFNNRTPGGGEMYIHNTKDSCATVYHNKIKVYTNRTPGIPNKECIPALFDDVEWIETP